MYREGVKQLKEWKLNKNKKPLIFYGARQVGKTIAMIFPNTHRKIFCHE